MNSILNLHKISLNGKYNVVKNQLNTVFFNFVNTHFIHNIQSNQSTKCKVQYVKNTFGSYAMMSVPGNVDLVKHAGALAARLRESGSMPVLLQATGTAAVNMAVKSIGLAQRMTFQKLRHRLHFIVNHREGMNKDRASRLTFAVFNSNHGIRVEKPRDDIHEIRVCEASFGRKTGAEIASHLRNNGSIIIRGIGPRVISNMIVAMTWARRMIKGLGYEAIASPRMIKVRVNNDWTDTMRAVELMITQLNNQPYNYLDFNLHDGSTDYLYNEVMDNINESINASRYHYEF